MHPDRKLEKLNSVSLVYGCYVATIKSVAILLLIANQTSEENIVVSLRLYVCTSFQFCFNFEEHVTILMYQACSLFVRLTTTQDNSQDPFRAIVSCLHHGSSRKQRVSSMFFHIVRDIWSVGQRDFGDRNALSWKHAWKEFQRKEFDPKFHALFLKLIAQDHALLSPTSFSSQGYYAHWRLGAGARSLLAV